MTDTQDWRQADDGHGPYWRWDGYTINKPKPATS